MLRLDKYQVVKKSKEKVIFWWIYVTPFHLAALIGHLWLWQGLLGGFFLMINEINLLHMIIPIGAAFLQNDYGKDYYKDFFVLINGINLLLMVVLIWCCVFKW